MKQKQIFMFVQIVQVYNIILFTKSVSLYVGMIKLLIIKNIDCLLIKLIMELQQIWHVN